MTIAVITTDIIRSSKLSGKQLEATMGRLEKEVIQFQEQGDLAYYESFRGDSMQMIIPDPEKALEIALRLKFAINRIKSSGAKKRGAKIRRDLRIAIGIGETNQSRFNKMTSETPFVRSGQKLDAIDKENRTIGIATGNEQLDKELDTELYLLEGIFQRWTIPLAEVVYHKLQDKTEQAIAEELKISQSAVNQRGHSAYWSGVRILLERYEELVTDHLKEKSHE